MTNICVSLRGKKTRDCIYKTVLHGQIYYFQFELKMKHFYMLLSKYKMNLMQNET